MVLNPADSESSGAAGSPLERPAGFDPGPYDIEVRLRIAPEQADVIRQVRITYAEAGRRSEFLYDCTDPMFAGNREVFIGTAFGTLLAEVKSRVVAGDSFEVWHKTEAERLITQEQVELLAKDDVKAKRFVRALLVRSRIIPLD
jgi:hypothetical protein